MTLLLVVTGIGFIALLFLPAIVEIARPKDKRPRRITRTPLQRLVTRISTTPVASKPLLAGNSQQMKVFLDILSKAHVRIEKVGDDTLRVFDDLRFPANLDVPVNIVVQGELTVDDHCVIHGSLKAQGNVFIGNSVTVMGNIISKGNVSVQDRASIHGSVHARGTARLGEKASVWSSVVADRDVELYENSEVKKNIITQGAIRVLKSPTVDFPSAIENID